MLEEIPPPPVGRGARRRRSILATAAELATTEGLERLSLGELAAHLEMSKSGLFAHFGSKEELQLAAIEHARQVFLEEVVRPGLAAPRGIRRARALCESWLGYCEREVFPGGCFFSATTIEYSNRSGPVHDRLVEVMSSWTSTIERTIREAIRLGELRGEPAPAQLAFELQALIMGANWAYQLHRDRRVFKRARTAIHTRLPDEILDGSAPGALSSPRSR